MQVLSFVAINGRSMLVSIRLCAAASIAELFVALYFFVHGLVLSREGNEGADAIGGFGRDLIKKVSSIQSGGVSQQGSITVVSANPCSTLTLIVPSQNFRTIWLNES